MLTDDEKELGVALVEMGAATTDLAVFHEGKIRHLGTIAYGGINVVPTTFLVDASGKIVERIEGARDHAAFAALVRKAM